MRLAWAENLIEWNQNVKLLAQSHKVEKRDTLLHLFTEGNSTEFSIRGYWGVENKVHYVRCDPGEDGSRRTNPHLRL